MKDGDKFKLSCPYCGAVNELIYDELYEELDAIRMYCWYCERQFTQDI